MASNDSFETLAARMKKYVAGGSDTTDTDGSEPDADDEQAGSSFTASVTVSRGGDLITIRRKR
jgi:hypothetical protein